jgi:Flp pilus assembly protein TadG
MSRLGRALAGLKRSGRPRREQGGQALVEFALTLPLFALFVFVVIQLAVVLVAYYSETRMARESARWLAINRQSDDITVATHVQNTMLPGLVNGTPSQVQAGSTTLDAIYTDGKMTVQFTPCVMVSSSCTHTNRSPGATLYVQMSYDVSNILFLPTQFGFGNLTVKLPTALPVYRVYVMVE